MLLKTLKQKERDDEGGVSAGGRRKIREACVQVGGADEAGISAGGRRPEGRGEYSWRRQGSKEPRVPTSACLKYTVFSHLI